jgi:hypothetical protein
LAWLERLVAKEELEVSEEATAKAIRGLTTAVWALTVVAAAAIAFPFIWSYVADWQSTEVLFEKSEDFSRPEVKSSRTRYVDEYEDFYDWPIEKQVAKASAILLTSHVDDGERIVSTVSEVLLLRPGTTLHYKVGDEYRRGTRYKRSGVSYGDGEIVFMTGSPASMRYSTSYADGRCIGLGDMPIEKLREVIAARSQARE